MLRAQATAGGGPMRYFPTSDNDIVQWRATADEDGHYYVAIQL